MKVKLFNSEVEVKDVTCGRNGEPGIPYFDKAINVYTCLTHVCNAKCKFCEYCYKDAEPFDFEKWKKCIDEIMKEMGIFKASFTGGEPSLQKDLLVKCLDYLKSKDYNIFTIINTNGTNLDDLVGIKSLNNIALSRHAIDDAENREIFGINGVPDLEKIHFFPEKEKLHLSCNFSFQRKKSYTYRVT